MKLIAGLGNPGKDYSHSRHNAGFIVIDAYLAKQRIEKLKKKLDADFAELKIFGEDVVFCKPRTFMNLSGTSIVRYVKHFRVDHENLLVIHDDCDFELGVLRVKFGGGTGGHKGIQSVIENLGVDAFARLRVGIGRREGDLSEHVLNKFSNRERLTLNDVLQKSERAIDLFIKDGYIRAMNEINRDGVISAKSDTNGRTE